MEKLVLGGVEFKSRLLTGTGKFSKKDSCRVKALEIDPKMAIEAKKLIKNKNIEIILEDVEETTFKDNTFDYAVITLALCTIPDPKRSLLEARRILKPNGKLIVLEHVKNDNLFLAKLQDLLAPIWKRFAFGCHLNRDTPKLIKNIGFNEISIKYFWGGNFISAIYEIKG